MNANVTCLPGVVAVVAVILTASADASAPAGRYVMASGTVYDSKTKLTWQQTAPSKLYTWADAQTYCAGVAASLGGTGWRLPTIKELQTIVDDSRGRPSIDPTAFPTTPEYWFWSSSPSAGSSPSAWYVFFGNGFVGRGLASYPYNVRCVR
jgi:hypothetical protein